MRVSQSIAGLLLLSSSTVSAFDLSAYTTEECSGSSTSYKPKVSDGCNSDRGSTISGMILKWTDDADNDLVLATYEGEKCCHDKQIQTIDWQDGCIKLQGSPGSWRVLNPDDPDKGKKGEKYTC